MSRIKTSDTLKELIEAFMLISDKNEMKCFLRDLCTPQELHDLAERWQVCKLLDEGVLSYRDIKAQTGTSLSTITRVARFLKNEPYRGYRSVIDKMKEQK